MGESRRRALFLVVPVDADVLHLGRISARDQPGAPVARLHRGDRRHLHRPRQRGAGRRHRPVRPDLGLHELRDRCAGPGRQVHPRRARLRRGRLQPRGRHGRHRDVGARQADRLPRAADQAERRRLGAAPRRVVLRETLLLVHGTPDFEIENIGAGGMLTSPGIFGGYPAPSAYVHNIIGSDLYEQAAAGEAYPVADVSGENPRLSSIGGEHMLLAGPLHDDDPDEVRGHLPVLWARGRRPRRPAPARRRGARERHRGRAPRAALGRPRLCARRSRVDARPAPRARPAGVRVVGRAARARARAGPGRAGQGDVQRIDAPRAALGRGVPRLLGPAGGLRLRRGHPDGRPSSARRRAS